MADKKISALTAASTPLAGTEVLPIVQSGATVKVSVSDLTAGRAISATSVTASTGNFVVGTSGQGIDFSATPGTGTSELLDDYEEGTWTAADATGAGVTITNNATAKYTKIGRLVIASCNITIGATASATVAEISLPFAANVDSGNSSQGGIVIEQNYSAVSLAAAIDSTTGARFRPDGGAGLTYASLSGKNLRYTIIYVEN